MKYILMLGLGMGLAAMSPDPETTVSNPQSVATVPRLTTDATGNPLLSWVEKTSENEARFYFAVSPDGGQTFGEKISVNAPRNLSAHAEGMPKIAVKADGTLLAVFEEPRPTPESRFGADLLYTLSTDQGKTWSETKSIRSDAVPGKSRSFADITRLPNGEIGIVWLDEKRAGMEGRPVLFAQTTKGQGFGPAVVVDENACQCCRTNVFVDRQKRIHLTYRDLIPSGKIGELAARDISTVVSTDGGKTFSKPKVVFADQWRINACPHAGPSVAQVGNDVLVTWFSGKENAIGVRLARLGSNQLASSILSDRVRHPQVISNADQLIWAWDESISKDGSGEMGTFVQRIGMQTFEGPKRSSTVYLTPTSVDAAYPTLLATKKGLLVAYEQTKKDEKSAIVVRLVRD